MVFLFMREEKPCFAAIHYLRRYLCDGGGDSCSEKRRIPAMNYLHPSRELLKRSLMRAQGWLGYVVEKEQEERELLKHPGKPLEHIKKPRGKGAGRA